jgi:sugar phosphate isomerase/epimerase
MQLDTPGAPHLTYCTNIHPGESWGEVKINLEQHVSAAAARVRAARAFAGPFGVGLRLSARAVGELRARGELDALKELLKARGLYVFTMNGFPYGTFHRARVKEAVYDPDWLEAARLDYTIDLAELLAELLPQGVTGSVSSVPCGFRSRVRSADDAARAADSLLRAAAHLCGVRTRTGKTIQLLLEPEPCCHLETSYDAAAFFERHLLARTALDRFAGLAGVARGGAEEAVRRHLGVCLDACHMAVEFEDAADALGRLAAAGIGVGKIQISAGLEVAFRRAAELDSLAAFADDVYLHQVVERHESTLTRYLDLPEALAAAADGPARERLWRIHYHVPVFLERLGPFRGTQPFLRDLLRYLGQTPISPHLEVETYTWDVLPHEHRQELVDSIARELTWVLGHLGEPT